MENPRFPLRSNGENQPVSPEAPNPDDIASLAYRLWDERGRPIGSPEEDWFQAEQELQQKQEA